MVTFISMKVRGSVAICENLETILPRKKLDDTRNEVFVARTDGVGHRLKVAVMSIPFAIVCVTRTHIGTDLGMNSNHAGRDAPATCASKNDDSPRPTA
jgi:hypothetical protein